MERHIQHPVYGEIIYNENFWSGKKTIKINGIEAKHVSKNTFEFEEKRILIQGNDVMGVSMFIDHKIIQISPKPTWYEILFAVLPFAFLLIWGNSSALCAIFPVVGGAIGGALGGVASILSLTFIKRSPSVITKILIGIAAFVITVLIAFVLALALLQVLA